MSLFIHAENKKEVELLKRLFRKYRMDLAKLYDLRDGILPPEQAYAKQHEQTRKEEKRRS